MSHILRNKDIYNYVDDYASSKGKITNNFYNIQIMPVRRVGQAKSLGSINAVSYISSMYPLGFYPDFENGSLYARIHIGKCFNSRW